MPTNVDYLHECFDFLRDRDLMYMAALLSYRGRGQDMLHSSEVAIRLVSATWCYCLCCVGSDAVWLRNYSHGLPGRFFALLSPDHQQSTLQELKRWWRALQVCEQFALNDPIVEGILEAVVWTTNIWVREVLVALDEACFESVPDDILLELEEASQAQRSTKVVEDSFNLLRDDTRHTKQGAQGRRRRFHCLTQSNLLPDSDRPRNIHPSVSLPTGMGKGCSEAFEMPQPDQFSLGSDSLEVFLRDTNAMTSTAFLSSHMAWSCILASEHDLNKLSTGWLSLLARRGHIIFNPGSGQVGLVLHATCHGVLLWRCRVRQAAKSIAEHWVDLHPTLKPGESTIEHVLISKVSDWKTLPTVVLPPCEVARLELSGSVGGEHQILVRCDRSSRAVSLVEAAAKEGFRGLTIQYMDKMISEFSVQFEGPKPRLERDLAMLLVQWALPGRTAEQYEEMISARGSQRAKEFTTVLNEANVDVLKEAVGGQGCEDDIVREVNTEALKQKVASGMLKLGTVVSRKPAASSSSSSSTSTSSSSVVPSGAAAKPQIERKEWTILEARSIVPRVTGCSITIHTDTMWQVKYGQKKDFPRSHSSSFTPGDADSSYAALVRCLVWVWRAHRDHTGQECPFDLGVAI